MMYRLKRTNPVQLAQATAVGGDRTCLHGQKASVAPPSARVNVTRRRMVGRRWRFDGADVSSGGTR